MKTKVWRENAKRARESQDDQKQLSMREIGAFPTEEIVKENLKAICAKCENRSLGGKMSCNIFFTPDQIVVDIGERYSLKSYNDELDVRVAQHVQHGEHPYALKSIIYEDNVRMFSDELSKQLDGIATKVERIGSDSFEIILSWE